MAILKTVVAGDLHFWGKVNVDGHARHGSSGFDLLAMLRRRGAVLGRDRGTAAVRIGAFVQRVDGSEDDPAAAVDQIDPAEIPARVAHGQFAEVAIPCRDLEPHALERDRAIALTLSPAG